MDVHTLEAQERRMLLEMLASERAGEEALHVGEWFGRNAVAHALCRLRMTEWVDDDHVAFTPVGRRVAEALAERLVRPADRLAC
jgi:hypothetical protein